MSRRTETFPLSTLGQLMDRLSALDVQLREGPNLVLHEIKMPKDAELRVHWDDAGVTIVLDMGDDDG